jgi:RNA polymerase sigma factor (sigma-70 family)
MLAECDEHVLMQNRPDRRTDAELLRRSHRDPDAFIVVCHRHARRVEGWLRKELQDDVRAQEVLAETLAAAWFSSRRFRDQGEGAGPWLHGIARNLVLRMQRDGAIESRARVRLGLPVAEEDGYDGVLNRLDAEQEFARISEPLDRLPAEQRKALELRVVEVLDYAEVGERLRISPQAARVRVFRALSSLRSQIGDRP